jgi:hypothetical protein
MFCGLAPVHLPRKTSWLVTCLISVFYQADMNCHIFTEYLCIDMQGNMSYKYCIVMGFYSRESIGFWPAPIIPSGGIVLAVGSTLGAVLQWLAQVSDFLN